MKNITLMLMFLFSVGVFAQKASIELSIEWRKKEYNSWKGYKLKETPFLVITYINNSDNAIYFLKVPKYFDFGISWSTYNLNQVIKKDNYFSKFKRHNDKKYSVVISPHFMNHYWEVLDDGVKFNEEHESSFLNEDLHNIYKKFYKDYKIIENPFVFTANNNSIIISEDNIETKLKEYFVFLKPGEKYVNSYDLTGFYILGGVYNFRLSTNQLNNFVETIFLSVEKGYKKEVLPIKVRDYNLYSGEVKTNDVNVVFHNIK